MIMDILSRLMMTMLVGTLALTSVAHAADKKDKSSKRIAQIMQKAQQEKAEMQAQFDQEKAALEDKAKKSEQEASEIKGGLATANRKNKVLIAEMESLRKEQTDLEARQQKTEAALLQSQTALENTSKKLADMTQQYQTAQHEIKDGDTQRKELLANLSKKGQQVMACNEKNARLHDFGTQLIAIYDNPSIYDAVLRTEPFAQTKRVELENILQDYRDKLDEQRAGISAK